MSEPGEEQTFGGEFGPSFLAEPGTSPVAEPEAEVLSLVFKDVPVAVKAGDIEEGMSEHERMSRLNMRRESLKFVLSRTISNLAHFIDQCRSNPSCEVRALSSYDFALSLSLFSFSLHFVQLASKPFLPGRVHLPLTFRQFVVLTYSAPTAPLSLYPLH